MLSRVHVRAAIALGATLALALGAASMTSRAAPGASPKGAAAAPSASASAAASASASASVEPPVPAPGGAVIAEGDPPVMVVDLHVDVPWQVHFKGRDPHMREGHSAVTALAKGAYGGLVFPIYLPDYLNDQKGPNIADADAVLGTIDKIIATAGVFVPPGKPAEAGKITAFLSIEGAGAFADDVTQVDRFIARGVRLIGPAHSKNNRLASSATGDKVENGLTAVGKEFCDRVYAHGALVDVSHLSDKSFADLLPIAKKYGAPIVATHSNSRAIADHPRNLTDDELRTIAETGGVAGLNFYGAFVSLKKKPTIDDVVKQVEHMIAVAGIDHVAIGSDFDGAKPAKGLDDASMLPALAEKLKRKGLSHDDVLKIFSLNALRVLGWRSAAQIQAQIDAANAEPKKDEKAPESP